MRWLILARTHWPGSSVSQKVIQKRCRGCEKFLYDFKPACGRKKPNWLLLRWAGRLGTSR
jgi:hypothetical protein